MAPVGQMATQWPQSMQRSHEFSIGTGKSFFVIKPPGQALIQLPHVMHKSVFTLMIVSISSAIFSSSVFYWSHFTGPALRACSFKDRPGPHEAALLPRNGAAESLHQLHALLDGALMPSRMPCSKTCDAPDAHGRVNHNDGPQGDAGHSRA